MLASPPPLPVSYRDAEAIHNFVSSEGIHVLTMEIEHVDADAVEVAAKQAGLEVEPTPGTIRVGGESPQGEVK